MSPTAKKGPIVAIDGPAGSGKSTVAKLLAKRLGFTTVWINRRHDRPGSGATPPADAQPDATFPDMASFAAVAVPD